MPAIETQIWLALRGRVASLVLSPVHAVSWPNEPFTAPQGGVPVKPLPYLRVTHLPNNNERLFINRGSPSRRMGVLQVSAMYPLALVNGETYAREIAGQVAAHFPADLVLTYDQVRVRITKSADVAQGFRDDASARWMTPVSIFYDCFA